MIRRPAPRLLTVCAIALGAGACSSTIDLDLDTRVRPCTSPSGQVASLRWYSPDDSDHRRQLDAWCEAVGTPVVYVPSIGLPPAPLRQIALISWNVHVGGGDVAKLISDLQSGRLTSGVALPFVLLLQEAFRSGEDVPPWRRGQPSATRIAPRPASRPRMSVPALARRLALHLVYVPSMRNGPGDANREDRGAAILSTLPVTELSAIELPFERQRRVAIAARIARVTDQEDLWVVNAHLENRTGGRRLWLEAPAARARQAKALVKKFLPDGPAVLGGDLNTWATDEPTIEFLKDVFDTPVGDDLRATLPGVGRIDYLLARLPSTWSMTSRRLDSQYGSDHFPVLGILTFPEPAASSAR